jgi:hypothetical protein
MLKRSWLYKKIQAYKERRLSARDLQSMAFYL